jgi:hypothetical protein
MLIRIIVAVTICLVCLASDAHELIANFDQFPETALGTTFVDGGITFSDLQELDGGGVFTTDDPSSLQLPDVSAPNVLITNLVVPGPIAGYGPFHSFRMTPSGSARLASLDLFTSFISENFGKSVSLIAFSNGRQVAATSALALQDLRQLSEPTEHNRLVVSATVFDSLSLVVTDEYGNPGLLYAAIDNVKVSLVPEPSTLILVLCGILSLPQLGFFATARH